MPADTRRAPAKFELSDARGIVVAAGEGEAVIGDDALTVASVSVAFLDADAVRAAAYRIELDIWPDRRLVLSGLGRRFDAFVTELRRVRNQARVAGLLAHGLTMPEVYDGTVLIAGGERAAEFQLYDTHVTVVPQDQNPFQLPFGAVTSLRTQDDPPAILVESSNGTTTLRQLGRRRDLCLAALAARRGAQQKFLAELTGDDAFSDGWGVTRSSIRSFDELLGRFTAEARVSCRQTIIEEATGEPRFGLVQLLDPDGERLSVADPLPDPWAAFLLVPSGDKTVLELLAGPSAATYVFRGTVDVINRDLQQLHFRRAQLALTPEQAEVTPSSPHRLALRLLEPLRRLREATVARIVHNDGWEQRLRAAVR